MQSELTDVLPIVHDIAELLKSRKETVATMESCTAGLIAFYLTAIDGSSDYLKKSYITYCNEAKIDLGVSRHVLERYSVYSSQVAQEMAWAAVAQADSTYGLGITGMCGSGNEPHIDNGLIIPAGTVCISVYGPTKSDCTPFPSRQKYKYTDQIINVKNITDRNDKRSFAAMHALLLFHSHLLMAVPTANNTNTIEGKIMSCSY